MFCYCFLALTFLPILVQSMETKGDEHLHHPLCEICQKEYSSTRELSVRIDQVHRNKDKVS
jgi:hypothetical protein